MFEDKVESIALDTIFWPERQRTTYEPEALSELADSISAVGLIQPILITGTDNRLVAGGRRVKAHELLGRTHIQAVRKDNLSHWELEAIELIENLHRVDLSYSDEIRAKARFHDVYVKAKGTHKNLGGTPGKPVWRLEDTARLLGVSTATLSTDIALARAMETNPDLGKFQKKSQAISALNRAREQTARRIIAAVSLRQSAEPGTCTDSLTQPDIIYQPTEFKHGQVACHNLPASALVDQLTDSSVASIITDPPWQVMFDAEFDADPTTGLELTEQFLTLIKPKLVAHFQGWLFCATKHLIKGTIYTMLADLGYTVSDQLFLWHKPNMASSSHPYAEILPNYEPAVWFSFGRFALNEPLRAVQTCTIKATLHPAQKPINIISTLIRRTTVEGELIVDPFCGSGVVGYCAQLLGRRAVIGDKNPDHFATACGVLNGTFELESENKDGR